MFSKPVCGCLNDMITSFPRKEALPPFVMRESDGGVYLFAHHSFLLVTDFLFRVPSSTSSSNTNVSARRKSKKSSTGSYPPLL